VEVAQYDVEEAAEEYYGRLVHAPEAIEDDQVPNGEPYDPEYVEDVDELGSELQVVVVDYHVVVLCGSPCLGVS